MKIVVCGNSISYGLELGQPASSREVMRKLIQTSTIAHPSAWPGQLQKLTGIETVNFSLPASGVCNNFSRCLEYSRTVSLEELKNHFFLIDVSMAYQLAIKKNDIARAPVFFSKGSIQETMIFNLNAGSVNTMLWSIVQVLEHLGIKFLFFSSMYPFITSEELKPFVGRPENREEYALFLYESQWRETEFAVPAELESYFLNQKTLIGSLDKRDVTRFIHPVSASAHEKILVDVILPGLRKNHLI